MLKIRLLFISPLIFIFYFWNNTTSSTYETNDSTNNAAIINKINANLKIVEKNQISETDSFLTLARKILELSNNINYTKGIYESYYNIAHIFRHRNLNDSALHYFKKGIEQDIHDYDDIAKFYWYISNIYRLTGNYSNALRYSIILKEFVESGKSSKYSYQVYNLLALSYQSLMEYDLAKDYYEKAASHSMNYGDTAYSGVIFANIGKLLYDLGRYDESLEYFKKGTAIEKKFNLYGSLGNSYITIANIFLEKDIPDSAFVYLNKATKLHKKINNKLGLTFTLLGVCQYYYKIKDYKNALFFLDLTIRNAESYSLNKVLSKAHQLKANIHAEQHEYELAYKHFDHFFKIYSHLYDVKEINKAKALEQKLAHQERENNLVELQLKKQKTINILLFIVVSLSALVVIIISYYLVKVKHFNKQLKKSKEKAEESDQLKSQFLNNISHEIRTPLNGIIGFSRILVDEDVEPEDKYSFLLNIEESSDKLINTIENIVEMAHLSTQQYHIKKSKFELNSVLRKVESQIKNFILLKGKSHIDLNLNFNHNIEIYSDKNIITKIILHIIKNAVLFTEDGSIELGYTISNENQTNETIIIYVKDTGIGIPQEKIDIIFSTFQHGEDNINIKVGGTGLGLSIVSKFVQLLKGKIWVESEINKGSTFYISLPIK